MDSVPTDLAYAAGVIDSDGWIGVRRTRHRDNPAWQSLYAPRIVVKQVTPQAVELLHNVFGGHRSLTGASLKRGRPLHVWEAHSVIALRVCEALAPYLRIKREQAENAIEVGRINASAERRRFEVPAVGDGEPLLPLLDAARQAGRSAAVAYQSASLGNIPCVRHGRRVFVPASFVPIWAERGSTPARSGAITERLEACFQRAKELNRVGL